MESKGIDCATPLTAKTAAAIKAAGYDFAARYLVPSGYKRLTRAEAEAITAAGMQIVSVYETTANRALGGKTSAVADGAAAYKEAVAIGQPSGSTIYFAVDFDAAQKDYAAILAYFTELAVHIPGYEVGVYGEHDVIEFLATRGVCEHFWQTYAWSGGKQSEFANIYQWKNGQSVAGVGVDFNKSFGGEGWWNTKEVQEDMSKEDGEKIIRFLSAGYMVAADDASRKEFKRLADEVRKVAGIPIQ